VGFLAATSRLSDDPLSVIVQSSSAAGKSTILNGVLGFMPPESRIELSAVTGQSLYYLPPEELKNKILCIAEQEGGRRASYALKLLQSEKSLTIASTTKEAGSGRLRTEQYKVQGPVAIFSSTTAAELDPELANRSIILTADESPEQTRAVHRVQRDRETMDGLRRQEERTRVLKLHQNAQRLLRSLRVLNPFAPHLAFPDSRTRLRRDFAKYLGLARAVALLHQYQREVKKLTVAGETMEYVEVTPADIALANRLAHRILGRALDDCQVQTRRMLGLIDQMVRQRAGVINTERREVRFSQRQLREFTGWGATQTKVHLKRLLELEFVVQHQGGRGRLSEYQLLFDGDPQSAEPHFPGLIDPSKFDGCTYDGHRSGLETQLSGAGRPQVGPESGDSQDQRIAEKAKKRAGMEPSRPDRPENPQSTTPGRSYPQAASDVASALTAVPEEGR
jgi:energy-coupling factor transporter ATP-binding protein EcfA2